MISRTGNILLSFKNILGYVTRCSDYYKWNKLLIYSHNTRSYCKHLNVNNTLHMIRYSKIFTKVNSRVLQRKAFVFIPLENRPFCTKCEPKKADVFGDIGYKKYDKVEMDEEEKEEEEFQDNEVRIPCRLKPSTGQYSKIVKSHIEKGDLSSALDVLQLLKRNRDKPTVYMYNLLIRAYAVQGNTDQCFKLYNKMKKHQLIPNAATYNSLFNACAESKDHIKAIEQLNKLRIHLHEKKYALNETHYNTLLKAYSWHNHLLQAFEIVDEMRDKRLRINEITYNCLLHAAISDKEAGMRHAIIVWHLMRKNKIKPSLITYNLFLRAMRDTMFGNCTIRDIMTPELINTDLYFSEGQRPNLLSSPPIFGTLPIPITSKNKDMENNLDFLKQESDSVTLSEDTYLNDIFKHNRFILFGGLQNILNTMQKDGVIPNAITATLLLELIPNTASAEDSFLNYVQSKNIILDIDFYNMLIKRRSMRKEYDLAKNILEEIQRKNMVPNLMTFGVLALGCTRSRQGRELLEGLEIAGYMPNAVILGSLIRNACCRFNTNYIIELLHYMDINKIKPSEKLVSFLENYKKTLTIMTKSKKTYKFKKKSVLMKDLETFEKEYCKWKKKLDDVDVRK